VGGSGVLINTLALILLRRTGPHFDDVFIDLPGTAFNIRWYHLYLMISFLVANLWNFQLNRHFTFRSAKHSGWWREYAPFLAVGLAAQLIGLGLATLLMHPGSPLSLPSDLLDNSTGLRTKLYWANLIVIAVTVPLSFVLNKLWTFSSVRGGVHPSLADEEVAEVHDGTAPASTLATVPQDPAPGSGPSRAA
jgi:putative flippase GtrA